MAGYELRNIRKTLQQTFQMPILYSIYVLFCSTECFVSFIFLPFRAQDPNQWRIQGGSVGSLEPPPPPPLF